MSFSSSQTPSPDKTSSFYSSGYSSPLSHLSYIKAQGTPSTPSSSIDLSDLTPEKVLAYLETLNDRDDLWEALACANRILELWEENPGISNACFDKLAGLYKAMDSDQQMGTKLLECLRATLPHRSQALYLLEKLTAHRLYTFDTMSEDVELVRTLALEMLHHNIDIYNHIFDWDTVFPLTNHQLELATSALRHRRVPASANLLLKLKRINWMTLFPHRDDQWQFISRELKHADNPESNIIDVIERCTLLETEDLHALAIHLANSRRRIEILNHLPLFALDAPTRAAMYPFYRDPLLQAEDLEIIEIFQREELERGLERLEAITRKRQISSHVFDKIEDVFLNMLNPENALELTQLINSHPSGMTLPLVTTICKAMELDDHIESGEDETKIRGAFYFTHDTVEDLLPEAPDGTWFCFDVGENEPTPTFPTQSIESFHTSDYNRGALLYHWSELATSHYTTLYLEKQDNGLTVFIADSLGQAPSESTDFTATIIASLVERQNTTIYALQVGTQIDYSSCLQYALNATTYFLTAENVIEDLTATDTVERDAKGIFWVARPPSELRKMTQSTTRFDTFMDEGGDAELADGTTLAEIRATHWFYSPSHNRPFNVLPDLEKARLFEQFLIQKGAYSNSYSSYNDSFAASSSSS